MATPAGEVTARPDGWPSAARAAAVVMAALGQARPVCVWGHDDIDGIASAAIIRAALAGRPGTLTYIPPKDNPHYGLDTSVIDQLLSQGIGLIITVDSGISSGSEAAYALSKGLRLVITDHHELPLQLPSANAIVDPKIREDGAPSRDLSGAAVALYLASLLRGAGGDGWLTADPRCTAWAALATVSDRVPLTGENRAILRAGMPILAQDPAVTAMARAIGLDLARGLSHRIISESLVALLAGGRSGGFEHETLAMLEGRADPACIRERWGAQQRWRAGLREQVEQKKGRLSPERDLISVIVDEQLPPEMIGPLAGRLRDATGYPVVVIGLKSGLHVGECRGFEPFDFTAMLKALAVNFVQSGGHRQAAGFTVKPAKLGETLVAIEEYAANHKSLVQSSIPRPEVRHRCGSVAELSAISGQLAAAAPYGPGNPEPVCEIAGYTRDDAAGSVLWLDELLASPGTAAPRTVTAAIDATHTGAISLRLLP